jgi:hypothetical protein
MEVIHLLLMLTGLLFMNVCLLLVAAVAALGIIVPVPQVALVVVLAALALQVLVLKVKDILGVSVNLAQLLVVAELVAQVALV